ncbi:MAG: PEP/pyruvate-binding domain-containing protein [Promethearchaeati archaeon SRVP18_Atabeyarchaeia-1]
MRYVVFFNEANPDPASLGGKGSNIVRLVNIGANVPPGFIITVASYDRFLEESKYRTQLRELLSKSPQPRDVVNLSRSIRKLVLESEVPRGVAREVRIALNRMRKESGNEDSFAVRSSATIEDMSTFSFAGQYETYLNNNSLRQILLAVRNCWASLFSLQALAYFVQMERVGKKYPLSDVHMAVVIQKMIDSQVSGVMFTANVMNNNRDQMMINSTWGLGEAIANNSVVPDMIVLEKKRFKILRAVIGEKEKTSVRNPRDIGTITIDTDPKLRARCSLNDCQMRELLELGLRLEGKLDFPQDIEWAIEDGRVYVLQSRPITTLKAGGQTQ